MTGWSEAAFDAYLPADMVLGQADIAVVVTDRLSNLLYVNKYAVGLFRISGDVARLAGCSVLSLGMFGEDDVRKTEDLAAQVLRLTGGTGADLVLESAGGVTFGASLAAARVAGLAVRLTVVGAGPAWAAGTPTSKANAVAAPVTIRLLAK